MLNRSTSRRLMFGNEQKFPSLDKEGRSGYQPLQGWFDRCRRSTPSNHPAGAFDPVSPSSSEEGSVFRGDPNAT
jgi:hypothetical protein